MTPNAQNSDTTTVAFFQPPIELRTYMSAFNQLNKEFNATLGQAHLYRTMEGSVGIILTRDPQIDGAIGAAALELAKLTDIPDRKVVQREVKNIDLSILYPNQ